MSALYKDCPFGCNNGYVFLESRGRVECPHCLGVERKAKRTNIDAEENIFKELCIPRTYWGIADTECFTFLDTIEQQKEQYTDTYIVVDVCRRMLNALTHGELYRDSLYLTFGSMDTDRFVYSAQMTAALQGIGTVPYITLNKLSMLLFSNTNLSVYDTNDEDTLTPISNMNGRNSSVATRMRKVMCGIDYTDYTIAPVVFLEMTPGTTDIGFLALGDLLAERARLCLPTYVIGYCNAYAETLNGELLAIANYVGHGLRKLTPLSLLKKPYISEYDKEIQETGGILQALEHYGEINAEVKNMGIIV